MLPAVPPVMVPTFAVVSSSMRPRRRSAIAFAAACTAERPSSGNMPECAAAVERHLERLRPRRAEHDLADRRGLVVYVTELCVQAVVVEGAGADEADLLLRREEQLDP